MADITVRMIFNRKTGKKDIWIDFESDEDALPVEHERRHREIVEHLLGQKLVTAEELGQVHVSRGGERAPQSGGTESPQVAEPGKLAES